ncbi:site-specific integrase [Facklamia hominis]|uniref:tyrosine-type recombinase/integrase n=1 Tax=Facklamia hominis TaxID=178214 RepID=UPI0029D41AB2|nr:site-specific integrase [Facklamia hominis]WPJ91044.1 site-specific integrase [Facklamia hominis]
MWIEELKNGKYKFVERYEDPLTGKTKKVSITLEKKTKKMQEQALLMLQEKIEKALHKTNPSKDMTLSELINEYLFYAKDDYKPSTLLNKKYTYKTINKRIGNIKVGKLSSAIVNNLIIKLKYNLACDVKTLIYQSWEFGKNHGYVSDMTLAKNLIKPKKPKGYKNHFEWKYLEPDEVKTVISSLKQPVKQRLAQLMLMTGMRFGETVALRISDVNLDNSLITISRTYSLTTKQFGSPKNGKTRVIHIPNEAKTIIKEQIIATKLQTIKYGLDRSNDLLFKSKFGKPYSIDLFNNSLKRIDLESGKNVTSHIFRHTFITRMVESGVSTNLIARHVGHANTDMIEKVYSHFSTEMDRKLEEAINVVNFCPFSAP